ncbi:50S ribosomal protein L25/general stress protein Ctc [Marinomonas mediterranea]|jgi:LSU ribosomal protein L25P|uniref:Large ribosomal subunit protein bL25 n=1 Tax=Marinomonas mediterranea (strain ATCC 700492 / JCM 21426 / NBRC 103028 / MMB-1) TaxID=717774 RepID=F2K0U8_MARM1|nr:50S ribosomal protein L25/general stress protein Ctc [Marinomonas mediterranea]ADZ92190.1 50S ribosomal protein L25 [Marinomonas mediterranea MMB-1]WCN10151.1 50S ribosomal protein L25/general stress protein Ctc [Marinomonas mediterranea]WCN14196.1 50S ribosomal protein L25/general stress protein Ctc [Marinomonas mediterranea]WCN18252.1 50S ribosomal protein L25/general stress protein Ctc [Marinomonas mediterranea MMB-1]
MTVIIEAAPRSEEGKGASRRLRKQGLVPAVIYGGETEAQSVTFKNNELVKAVANVAFLTSVVEVSVDGAAQKVLVKSLQRHPSTGDVMHVDLLRIAEDKTIATRIPLEFVNAEKSEGVKAQGGRLSVEAKLAEVRCLPKDLPASLIVDAIDGQLGQIFHLSDAQLPEGVELVALLKGGDHNQPIARIGKAKR